MADDDTFFREVNEQIRQDRAQALWDRYGKFIIGGAVAIVLGTAATVGWDYYQKSQAAASGDKYLEAIELSGQGNHDQAMAILEEIAENGSNQYPALAQMRLAAEMAGKGENAKALETYTGIAADSSFSPVFREIAQLRGGLLAVDLESYEQVEARLKDLAAAGNAFRHSAREALGIAALKSGNDQMALEWFTAINEDANAQGGVRARAQVMLDLLAGRGVKAEG